MQVQGAGSGELPVSVLLLRFQRASRLRIADTHDADGVELHAANSQLEQVPSTASSRRSTRSRDDPAALSVSVEAVEIHADIQTYDRLWWLTLLSSVQHLQLTGALAPKLSCCHCAALARMDPKHRSPVWCAMLGGPCRCHALRKPLKRAT